MNLVSFTVTEKMGGGAGLGKISGILFWKFNVKLKVFLRFLSRGVERDIRIWSCREEVRPEI